MTWHHIGSAPKDGKFVWLYGLATMRIGFWAKGQEHENFGTVGGGWRDYIAVEGMQTVTGLRFEPTHWMPLPEPPTWRLVSAEYIPNKLSADELRDLTK